MENQAVRSIELSKQKDIVVLTGARWVNVMYDKI